MEISFVIPLHSTGQDIHRLHTNFQNIGDLEKDGS